MGCFPYLRVLYLRQNPDTITDHHLWAIARSCPFLLELDLGDCAGVTDAGLAGPLQADARLGQAGGIASLTRLHSLNLCRFDRFCPSLGGGWEQQYSVFPFHIPQVGSIGVGVDGQAGLCMDRCMVWYMGGGLLYYLDCGVVHKQRRTGSNTP